MAPTGTQELASKKCIPCSGGTPPLNSDQLSEYSAKLPEWSLQGEHHIQCDWKFDDFKAAWSFVNKVAELAEQEGHHPEIWFTYGKVHIQLRTHKVDGLTEADFVLAAKISELSG